MENKESMDKCIDDCLECYSVCSQLREYCLMTGGEHVEQSHMKAMLDCAKMCAVSAEMMLTDSKYHPEVCGVCAKYCEECAISCEKFTDDENMKVCAETCRKCAQSCNEMAGT